MADAFLLVSHGSRDPRPQIAIDRLVAQLRLQLSPASEVEAAQLELADKPLHLQISNFARKCGDIDRVVILPLFLIPGVHVMEDIPTEVVLAQLEIGDKVKLRVTSFLGSDPDFANLFAQNRSSLPRQSIILAHGSRRAGGNEIVERLAERMDLVAAYWSVPPSLAQQVAAAIDTGATEIGIIPYFLFSGGITDAIAESVAQLQQQYPQVRLVFGEPIGNSPALVNTIGKILASIDP
ncbi:sirohydrochlorin chelatase [Chamaesiphon polymorphus]|uniref:sirohydrochlorin chelatase n=1 Tax=Chamaesiphon polymorphus TaxID=2107691 RepID=UPI001C627736|nr:sirohydrochlorin chelatase [Chamaesiphon polymorphus]